MYKLVNKDFITVSTAIILPITDLVLHGNNLSGIVFCTDIINYRFICSNSH